jgi:uncharacterized protein (DUF1015 family)
VPELRPFRGLRYSAARVPDLSAVLCSPYDVISVAERERLLARDPANAVRLELPAPTPAQATADDFARAAQTLQAWISDGTLARDERPMLYVYEQHFTASDGTARVARSFFGELRLEKYGPGSGVRPHEHTLGPAKEHRFQLLRATATHLSPVLLIYEGDSGALFDELTTGARPNEAIGPDGVGQRLWAIDPELVPAAKDLLALAGAQPLTIADGHHRYETALRYRDSPGAPAGADHVLALLFSAASGGLELEPWHRVITNAPDQARVLKTAAELFDATPTASGDELVEAIQGSKQAGILGVWTRSGGSVLRVKPNGVGPSGVSDEVRRLDVSVLSGTLQPMIGASEAELTAQGRLTYTHDAREAVHRVEQSEADVCFLLRPTPVGQVLAVAAAGDFMPPKSTYFHPKAATGLVFDPLF